MLVAFFRTHTADLFAYIQIFLGYLRISLYEARCLQADVGAITIQFNTTGKQGNVFFVEASRFTLLACQSTFD
ncbi:MAG: hypothetical protein WA874_04915 [Chryseosolibacter sp.]